MTLLETWNHLETLTGHELVEAFSKLNDLEKKYCRIKGNLRVANWHYEDMQKRPNPNELKATIEKKKQFEKIKTYEKLLENLESQHHLATG